MGQSLWSFFFFKQKTAYEMRISDGSSDVCSSDFHGGCIAGIVLAFVLFRVFDIAKPWPIRAIDRRVHGGFGIMIDYIVAGIAAAVVLFALRRWLLPF